MTQSPTIARGGGNKPSAPARHRTPQGRAKGSGMPPWLIPYVLLLPGLLVIAGLLMWPMVQVVIMSFQKVGLPQIRGTRPAEYVGFENYTKIFENDLFWTSLRNTVVFAAVTVTLTLVLGTAVGLLLHKLGKAMSKVLIIGLMSAWAVPPVSAAIIWRWLFDADAGIANWLLNLLPDWLSQALFGQADWSGHPWLNDTVTIYLILILCVLWASFPFISVSVLAGLKSIPSELYEAAKVDGSTPWRTFWKVTFPLLRPVFAVLTILSIIWDFKVLAQLLILAGQTNREAYNLSLYAFTEAFNAPPKMGSGAAIAVVLTLILLVITFVHVRQMVKQGDELR